MHKLELWEIAGSLKEGDKPPMGCPSILQNQIATKNKTTPSRLFLDLELIGSDGIWS